MPAGKNKIERSFRMLVDDQAGAPRDLSGDLVPGSIGGGGLTFDEVEMTGVSEAVKNFLAGHADSEIAAQFYLNDTALTGAFTVFKDLQGKTGTVDLRWGADGLAPVTGDPRWSGEYVCLATPIQLAGNKPIIAVRWKPTGAVAPVFSTVP